MVEIYLVQHGEAKPEAEDPQRPLTERGKNDVLKVAKHISSIVKASKILHSGKLRARQTAEVLAEHIKPKDGVEETSGLSPLDDVGLAKSIVEEAKEPLMLVGHMPHLSKLTSSLILGRDDLEVVKFRTSGVVCLVKDERGWKLAWALTPEVI